MAIHHLELRDPLGTLALEVLVERMQSVDARQLSVCEARLLLAARAVLNERIMREEQRAEQAIEDRDAMETGEDR